MFERFGFEDIVVVRKHLAEMISVENAKYIDETDYDSHMVVGLFEAKEELNITC